MNRLHSTLSDREVFYKKTHTFIFFPFNYLMPPLSFNIYHRSYGYHCSSDLSVLLDQRILT